MQLWEGAQMADPVVIVGMARTPLGAFQGAFSTVAAAELGATALKAAIERAGIAPQDIEETLLGCVLSAGQGQAPARQAAITAAIPVASGATTINKMCGSGMKAVMLAHDMLAGGSANIIVAGGMESMTNAPYLLDKARGGYRMGHGKITDHMFFDGLEDAYEKGRLMGSFAEDCAEAFQFSRTAQDELALRSLKRAQTALERGYFSQEIAPVVTGSGNSAHLIDMDEQPAKARPEKIPFLRPAFREDGTVTAANSSSISDGAAALVLMRLSEAEKRGLTPLARIVAQTSYAHEPRLFATAPIGAIRKLYEKTGWAANDVDLFEINEAFAVVTMAAMQELNLPAEKVNIHGGACALGHPIGASGARILVTLLAALQTHDLHRGIASICIGGGEATAIGVERFT
jgi:acetyl-CoA C-acetyltransferase